MKREPSQKSTQRNLHCLDCAWACCHLSCHADPKTFSIQLESGNIHLQSEISAVKANKLALQSDNTALKSALESMMTNAEDLALDVGNMRAERDRSRSECQRLQEQMKEQGHRIQEREAMVTSLEAVREKMEQGQKEKDSEIRQSVTVMAEIDKECQALKTRLASAHDGEVKLVESCRALEQIILEKVCWDFP